MLKKPPKPVISYTRHPSPELQPCLRPTELDPTQGQEPGSTDSRLFSSIHQAPWPLLPVVSFSALQDEYHQMGTVQGRHLSWRVGLTLWSVPLYHNQTQDKREE